MFDDHSLTLHSPLSFSISLTNFTNTLVAHTLHGFAAPNMAWIFLFWFLMFTMNLALIFSSFYQFLCLVDLESDDLNPFEVSNRINFWVEPEFLLQGLFCILLLVTGHWIIFLLAAPLACYHVNQYMKRQHLIDVTEVFINLKVEKKFRLVRLGFYVIFFILIVFRLTLSGFEALDGKDENPLSF